jgi:acetyl esterase
MPVTLDPDAAFIYQAFQDAGRPAYETLTAPEAREYYRNARDVMNPEPPALESNKTLSIPAPHGAIPARIYTPKTLRKNDGLAPCLVFFHGGGWVIGDLDTHDVVCQKLAHEGELIVISVDYRLAPEHKFPAAADDAITATKWVAANAKQLGIDAAHLLVGGDSAGGNLAAVVCLQAREAGGPQPAMQALLYPAADSVGGQASRDTFAEGFLLTRNDMDWFEGHYLPDGCEHGDPRVSIMRAPDVSNLPPAYVATAGFDPLRDEGETYATRMREAGVKVALQRHSGLIHGFANLTAICPSARAAMFEVAGAIRMGLG